MYSTLVNQTDYSYVACDSFGSLDVSIPMPLVEGLRLSHGLDSFISV